ncbi:MAG TPA: acylphosphatase [Gemmatimonadaceae bacterium]|jgi:acylphosphatase|nr:acylphosphatase [Gemmatimonadaceae bacterium]
MPSLHVRVTGKVQGVGFRWFVRENARRGELSGWVANRPDGSVEVLASGHPDCVDRLRRALRVGPDGARVEAIVDLSEGSAEPEGLPFPFAVLR